ncbi:MAG: hypothetical protein IT452_16045 [Planctomycetia bacterium]|nr:hypothetical protein [Planctomycetia bacterium]
MTPASRRAGLVAGLVLSLLCALGFAHRNTGDIADQCRAEMEARDARDAELESARASHAAEMEAVKRRIAELESDVARERGLREEADVRAAAAARPGAELEATKAELARAYDRMREMERGATGSAAAELAGVQVLEGEGGGSVEEPAGNGAVFGTRLVVVSGTESRIRDARGKYLTIETRAGLNQGVDYVAPEKPQGFEGGLNQGESYVDPYETGEKLEELRAVIDELRQVQKEQQ